MKADSYCVSRVDNTWGFYRFTLSPKEETQGDHCWYDIRLIYWCYDTSVANAYLLRTLNNLNAFLSRMYSMFDPYLKTKIYIHVFQNLYWFNVRCQNKPALVGLEHWSLFLTQHNLSTESIHKSIHNEPLNRNF